MTNKQGTILALLVALAYHQVIAVGTKSASAISQLPSSTSSYSEPASTTQRLDRSNFVTEGSDSGKRIISTVEDSNPMSFAEAENECFKVGGKKLIWNKSVSGESLKTCIN